MKDNNYYSVTGWMINRLHLSGSNLVCYAVIYGITQDGDTWFTGSLKYLQGWMNASQPTVIKALQFLTDNGYIIKKDVIKNNVRLCQYKNNIDIEGTKESLEGVVKFLDQGTKESSEGGSKESLDNNKYKDNNNIENKENNKENKDDLFIQFWNAYNKKVKLQDAKKAWKKLSNDDRIKAIAAIKPYQAAMRYEKQFFKYPSSYLNQRTWEDDFSDYTGKTFYEPREDDTERERRFKLYMREKHPVIEQAREPLALATYIQLTNEYSVELVEQQLNVIESNISRYKQSDIAYEISRAIERNRL